MNEAVYRIKFKEGNTEIDILGDKKFVNEAFTNVKGLLNMRMKNPEPTKINRKNKTGTIHKKKEKEIVDLKDISLEKLLELKPPKRENQRILLFAYYMNKILNKREFKGKDLEKLYVELKLQIPKNITYFLRSMSTEEKGLVAHGKKQGRYKITEKGIDFIYLF